MWFGGVGLLAKTCCVIISDTHNLHNYYYYLNWKFKTAQIKPVQMHATIAEMQCITFAFGMSLNCGTQYGHLDGFIYTFSFEM